MKMDGLLETHKLHVDNLDLKVLSKDDYVYIFSCGL